MKSKLRNKFQFQIHQLPCKTQGNTGYCVRSWKDLPAAAFMCIKYSKFDISPCCHLLVTTNINVKFSRILYTLNTFYRWKWKWISFACRNVPFLLRAEYSLELPDWKSMMEDCSLAGAQVALRFPDKLSIQWIACKKYSILFKLTATLSQAIRIQNPFTSVISNAVLLNSCRRLNIVWTYKLRVIIMHIPIKH